MFYALKLLEHSCLPIARLILTAKGDDRPAADVFNHKDTLLWAALHSASSDLDLFSGKRDWDRRGRVPLLPDVHPPREPGLGLPVGGPHPQDELRCDDTVTQFAMLFSHDYSQGSSDMAVNIESFIALHLDGVLH